MTMVGQKCDVRSETGTTNQSRRDCAKRQSDSPDEAPLQMANEVNEMNR